MKLNKFIWSTTLILGASLAHAQKAPSCASQYAWRAMRLEAVSKTVKYGGTAVMIGAPVSYAINLKGATLIRALYGSAGGWVARKIGARRVVIAAFYDTVANTFIEAEQKRVGPNAFVVADLINAAIEGRDGNDAPWHRIGKRLSREQRARLASTMGVRRVQPEQVLAAVRSLEARNALCPFQRGTLSPDQWMNEMVFALLSPDLGHFL